MKKQPSFLKKAMCLTAALMLLVTSAFATPTALTTIVLVQNNSAVTAGQLVLTFTACDTTNGNSFTSTGREVLIVNNTGASAYTFSIASVADNLGRTDSSLTNYSVGAGAIVAIQMKYQTGWLQSSTTSAINLTCSNAALKYAVVQYN